MANQQNASQLMALEMDTLLEVVWWHQRSQPTLILGGANALINKLKEKQSLRGQSVASLCYLWWVVTARGGDAMTIFPKIQHMSPGDAATAREALLRYCELDTWAMVKIWERLHEVTQ